MPKNPGNTGQRYKMTTIIGYEAQGSNIIRRLACGLDQPSDWGSPEAVDAAMKWIQRRVGSKTRCDQCKQ